MVAISKIKNSDGSISFRVRIHHGEKEICKTFYNKDDALAYSKFKENLLNNMKNFDVDIKDTVTLLQILELKKNKIDELNKKEINDFSESIRKISLYIDINRLYISISLQEWIKLSSDLSTINVHRGAQSGSNKRMISPKTLKKIFAHISSSVSLSRENGIVIDNHPLTVIQTHISKLLKKQSNED